jgi:hypothetical protein
MVYRGVSRSFGRRILSLYGLMLLDGAGFASAKRSQGREANGSRYLP